MSDRLDEMLENVQWGEFRVGELFDIYRGKNFPKSEWVEGDVPIVTTSGVNNGVASHIGNPNKSISNNTLTVAGTGTVGSTFYHPYEHNIGEWVLSLRLKKYPMNKYISLFFATVIEEQKDKYSYAYKMGNGRLSRQVILLPVVDGQPDWHFMEEYMKEVERNVDPAIDFELHVITDTRELDEVEWKVFAVGDLFEELNSGKSKGLNHLNQGGDIPYVAATNRNNGVSTFVQNYPDLISKGRTVVFIRNGEGSMGYSIYKSEDFIATSDVTMGYHRMLNKYTGMFVTTVADTVRGKYNFGYKRSAKRLKREGLLLPITSNDQPDWHYMEQYMRRLENQLMTQI